MLANTQQTISCSPCFHRLKTDVSLSSLCEVVGKQHLPAILGGNSSVQGYTILTAEPVEIFEFKLDEYDPFEKLSHILAKYELREEFHKNVPKGCFCGGWLGYFGYELGRFIEELPDNAIDDLKFPVIRLGFYDKAILFDQENKQFTLMVLDYEGQEFTLQQKLDQLSGWLDEAHNIFLPSFLNAEFDELQHEAFACNMDQQQYFHSIDRIKQYIYEGDTYQINFSQRFEANFYGRAIDLYHWQNANNPSPFSAYLAWEDKAVVSASPELFVKVEGDSIVTKPIKGTRPRNPSLPDEAIENKNHFHDLVSSEKEQAELAMIVDLERNDLARVCLPGSRYVSCERQIEIFPTVYHAVAVIKGQLQRLPLPERVVHILKGTFPGGSITGAPKIRSMEIIDELEPTTRNVYTGSIGWIGLNGDLCWNIAIRTTLISGQKAYIQTGGGIVADSDPKDEWDETLVKARALLNGVNAINPMRIDSQTCKDSDTSL